MRACVCVIALHLSAAGVQAWFSPDQPARCASLPDSADTPQPTPQPPSQPPLLPTHSQQQPDTAGSTQASLSGRALFEHRCSTELPTAHAPFPEPPISTRGRTPHSARLMPAWQEGGRFDAGALEGAAEASDAHPEDQTPTILLGRSGEGAGQRSSCCVLGSLAAAAPMLQMSVLQVCLPGHDGYMWIWLLPVLSTGLTTFQQLM